MNKKIATLGLAAVLGLAGVASLPVLAAKIGTKPATHTYVRTEGSTDEKGSVIATKTVHYTGVADASADQTVEDAAEIKKFLIGAKSTTAGIKGYYDSSKPDNNGDGLGAATAKRDESHAKIVAEGTPNVAEIKKAAMLEVKGGTIANITTYLTALKAQIATWSVEEKAKVEGLKIVLTPAKDAGNTITADDITALQDFIKDHKVTFEYKFDADAKNLDMTAFDNILPAEFANGALTISKKFTKITVKNALYFNEVKKIAGLGAEYVLAEDGAMVAANGFDNAVVVPTPEKPQTEKPEGNTNKTPNGTLGVADTGAAEF